MTRTVTDKHGTKYQLEIFFGEQLVRFNLRHNPLSIAAVEVHGSRSHTVTPLAQVGYANILIQGPQQWMIADLLIHNDSIIVRPVFVQIIRGLLRRKPKTQSFRGLGLGNVLLQSIIEEAREYGVRTISVKLWHKDRMAAPFLVQWCAKHGFREVSRATGHPRNCEVQMEITL